MISFTQENITTGAYTVLLMGGILAFAGAIIIYLDKISTLKNKKKKK